MKTKILIIAVFGLMTLLSCAQKKDVNAMLENENTRNEIFSSISENPEYMSDFRNYMQEHNMGSGMMKGSMNGMKNSGNGMMNGGGMMTMQDSTAMMNSFMNNPRMMSNMIQMMHTRGMMSDDCMNKAMANMQKEN